MGNGFRWSPPLGRHDLHRPVLPGPLARDRKANPPFRWMPDGRCGEPIAPNQPAMPPKPPSTPHGQENGPDCLRGGHPVTWMTRPAQHHSSGWFPLVRTQP
jgi:hypothetical protein